MYPYVPMLQRVLLHKREEGVVNILKNCLYVIYECSQPISQVENWALFRSLTKGSSKLYVRKIFQKSDITSPLIPTHTCAYQGVKNVSFSEKFACVLPRWFLTKTLFYVYVPDKNIQIKKGGSPGKTNRRDRNGYYNEVSLKYFSFFLSVNIRLLPYYSNIASYRSTNKPTNKR